MQIINKKKILVGLLLLSLSISANNILLKDSIKYRKIFQISGGSGFFIGQHSSVYSLGDKNIIMGMQNGISYFGKFIYLNEIKKNLFINVGIIYNKDFAHGYKLDDEYLTKEDTLVYDNLDLNSFEKWTELNLLKIPIGISYFQKISKGELIFNINFITVFPLNSYSQISYKLKNSDSNIKEENKILKNNLKITWLVDMNWGYKISLNEKIDIMASVSTDLFFYEKAVISEQSNTGSLIKYLGAYVELGILYNL